MWVGQAFPLWSPPSRHEPYDCMARTPLPCFLCLWAQHVLDMRPLPSEELQHRAARRQSDCLVEMPTFARTIPHFSTIVRVSMSISYCVHNHLCQWVLRCAYTFMSWAIGILPFMYIVSSIYLQLHIYMYIYIICTVDLSEPDLGAKWEKQQSRLHSCLVLRTA